MNMFITLDNVKAGKISLNQKIRISREAAAIGGSSMHLKPGETVPLVRLLTGMAVVSGNDAAMAVAGKIGGSSKNFVRMMNQKAKKLGLKSTTFKNPTGLPAAGQKTTAREMMRICTAYLDAHPKGARFHSTRFFMHQGLIMRNTNSLLGTVKGVDGLKTGWTISSGYNLVVSATRGKTRLLAVVLGGTSKQARDNAARDLLEAGFRNPARADKTRNNLLAKGF